MQPTKQRILEPLYAIARKILNYKTTVNLNSSIDKVIKYIQKKGTKKFKYNYILEIDNEKTPKTWKEKLF